MDGISLDMTGTFWSLIERAADEHPDRVLFADDYGRSLTAAGLRDSAEAVAAGLGLGRGMRVSWQLPTVLEAPVLLAALSRAGCIQNPIISMLRQRDLEQIVDQHCPELLIVPEIWRGYEHGEAARALGVASVVTLELERSETAGLRLPTGDPVDLPPPPSSPDEHRWTYFSSGTTGKPKGARHSDRTVAAGANGMTAHLGIAEGDVYPIAWPYPHIGGVALTAAVLLAGGTLVLFDTFDSTSAVRMAAHDPTLLGSAAPFFRAYLDAQHAAGSQPLYPRLRAVTAGGAPTPALMIDELVTTFGVAGLCNAWGLTEFPIATSCRPSDPPAVLRNSVGQPCAGVEARVVDGELRLRGPQCFLGYTDPALDRDAFDDEGWFRTGDLGRIDPEGYVTITGRSKDVIIRNAENVSAVEVEDVLRSHPDVVDIAVVGLPDPVKGELVCAVVVNRHGSAPDLADLVAHCASTGLPRQKAPEKVVYVDSLPRNSMGKVLKHELRQALTS